MLAAVERKLRNAPQARTAEKEATRAEGQMRQPSRRDESKALIPHHHAFDWLGGESESRKSSDLFLRIGMRSEERGAAEDVSEVCATQGPAPVVRRSPVKPLHAFFGRG